ncbi:CRTAC1 family protein [Novipirellula artificiosorum]|uniref:FG-GAP repeat protein n=1 Tax=Novipirellula artificiosorum TaxID=2528016 RepID=A0A5C6E3D4_9BACT|nr:CRTAC1 family protein [Novipirellula artificiosorum]TWU42477.1 hypothetical protein Poly41_07740 [Novipirellula artificiosorum]
MKRIFLAFLVLVAAAVVIIVVANRRPANEAQQTASSENNAAFAKLEQIRQALADTENLEVVAADRDWTSLYRDHPDDRSITLNRALSRVLHVDALTSQATNSLLTPAEKQAARKQLPEAIDAARQGVDDYSKTDGETVVALWLRCRVDLHEASLLPPTLTRSMRKEIFDRLVAAIEGDLGKRPGSIMLGGPLTQVLDEMEDPIDGLPKEIEPVAAKALVTLSDTNPENLYIALRAARSNLSIQSPSATAAVRRTGELARSIEPSLRRQTEPIGLTPDELVQKILDGIDSEDWSVAENQMLLWFNVLNSTELVKLDRRRSAPHPLDRLSFDAMRRASAAVAEAQPAPLDLAPITFDAKSVSEAHDVAVAIPIDFDLDLAPDVLTATTDGKLTLLRNRMGSSATWESAGSLDLKMPIKGLLAADLFMVDSSDPKRIQASGQSATASGDGGSSAAVADSSSRHNTFLTVIAYGDQGVRLVTVDGRGETGEDQRMSLAEPSAGLDDVTGVTAATVGDLEGDGDLDLVLATTDLGIRTFVNRGNRTFFETATAGNSSSLASQNSIQQLAIVDLDRDLDLDIVTLDQSGQVGLVENLLHLQFRFRNLDEVPAVDEPAGIAIGDLDGNISWDLVVAGKGTSVIAYSQTADAGAWTVDRAETVKQTGNGLALADFNNDIWPDVLRSSESAADVLRMGSKEGDTVQTIDTALGNQSLAVADFNLDGLLDTLAVRQGQPTVALNTTESTNHFLQVRFRGIDDNNANSGRVNHYAVGSVVEVRFGPYYRAEVITTPMTHFGLGQFDAAATLRVIFPNGLSQTILQPTVDTLVEEEQTLKGSCPYLYAWDGEKFAFVTDCLWAAPLGLQVAEGVVAKDRPWEYLKVDGDFVVEREGHYEMRITEELWEVGYFDHVALVAVDHPEEVDIWTNEKVGPAAIAKPTIFAFDEPSRRNVTRAFDTADRDVTEKLTSIDQDYVQGFDRRLRQGLCPPHWIDVGFAKAGLPQEPSGESVYLVLTGWILPTDTSLNIQIDQNPELQPIEFPSLWVPDTEAEGGWRKAIPYVGFPGGKTKTIVVDVTDAINRDDLRMRVRTSAQIYWDSAELVIQQKPVETRTHPLTLRDAELVYRGFSRRWKESPLAPETYDYTHVTETPKWPPLRGKFTNYGDCQSLVEAWDDSMVVMGAGDELRLRFPVPEASPPEGWKRDFVLHCVGWDKDADLNTLTGQSADPLPFKSMETYPPTRRQWAESEKTDAINAAHRQRTQSFQAFWQ